MAGHFVKRVLARAGAVPPFASFPRRDYPAPPEEGLIKA